MTDFHQRLDTEELGSLIRREVQELFARLEAERARPGDGLYRSEPGTCPEILLLTCRHAARLLGISERKLWELSRRGEIPQVRIDRSVRYDFRDLQAWVDTKKTKVVKKGKANGEHLS